MQSPKLSKNISIADAKICVKKGLDLIPRKRDRTEYEAKISFTRDDDVLIITSWLVCCQEAVLRAL